MLRYPIGNLSCFVSSESVILLYTPPLVNPCLMRGQRIQTLSTRSDQHRKIFQHYKNIKRFLPFEHNPIKDQPFLQPSETPNPKRKNQTPKMPKMNNQEQNRKTTNKSFLFHQKTNLYLLKVLQTPNPTNGTQTKQKMKLLCKHQQPTTKL